MKDIERFKIEIATKIQDFVNKITPVFESFHTIEEVEQAQKQLDRAYEGGRAAITNSTYKLTEEERNELYYIFDIKFSAVYDLARHAEFNIKNGIQ